MGKRAVPHVKTPKRGQRATKKNLSHSTFVSKRHPNSKRVTSGAVT
jgi:hypothetical protein